MHPLINMVFLTFATRRIGSTEYRIFEYHGKVLEAVGPDLFVVQLYDAVLSAPGPKKVVRADDMADWQFFDDWDDLDWALQYEGHLEANTRYARALIAHQQPGRPRALPAVPEPVPVPSEAPRVDDGALRSKLRERRPQ
jgi:hypothetical protein